MSLNNQYEQFRTKWFNVGFDAFYWQPNDPQPAEVTSEYKLVFWRQGWKCAKRYHAALKVKSK